MRGWGNKKIIIGWAIKKMHGGASDRPEPIRVVVD